MRRSQAALVTCLLAVAGFSCSRTGSAPSERAHDGSTPGREAGQPSDGSVTQRNRLGLTFEPRDLTANVQDSPLLVKLSGQRLDPRDPLDREAALLGSQAVLLTWPELEPVDASAVIEACARCPDAGIGEGVDWLERAVRVVPRQPLTKGRWYFLGMPALPFEVLWTYGLWSSPDGTLRGVRFRVDSFLGVAGIIREWSTQTHQTLGISYTEPVRTDSINREQTVTLADGTSLKCPVSGDPSISLPLDQVVYHCPPSPALAGATIHLSAALVTGAATSFTGQPTQQLVHGQKIGDTTEVYVPDQP